MSEQSKDHEELRIIKAARRNGRKLGVAPELTDSAPIRQREEHLLGKLGIKERRVK